MKTLLSSFLFLFVVCFSSIAQIGSANFNNGMLPDGWSSVVNTGPCDWDFFTNDPPRGLNFRSVALLFNDDVCGDNNSPSNVSLLTPVYNVEDTTPLLLTVEIGIYGENMGESLAIEVYDGTEWVTVKTFSDNWNPYVYQVDVTNYANDAFQVRFTYDDNGVWSYYAGIDNFSLTQEAFPDTPEQSNCESAEEITPGITSVSPIRRGNAPNICDPTSSAKGGAWFLYTASRDGIATVTSALSQNEDIDTNLSVLIGSCGDLECYAQNDDQSGNVQFSTISFEIAQGEAYYIVFDDRNNNQGFEFNLIESEETCNPGDNLAVNFTDLEEFQACHTTLDADGDGTSWNADAADFKRNGEITYFALNGANQTGMKEDYLFSPKLSLTAGVSYNISFTYNGGDSPFGDADEDLEVLMSDSPDGSGTMTLIFEDSGIIQNGTEANSFDDAIQVTGQEFIPETTGDYYLTFKTSSSSPSGFLLLFNYSIEPNTLGLNPTEAVAVNSFYNTVTKNLSIQSSVPFKSLALYTVQGQIVKSQKLQGNKSQTNLSGLADGIYIAQVATENGISTFKVLKR